jgi:hypothetical protein
MCDAVQDGRHVGVVLLHVFTTARVAVLQ